MTSESWMKRLTEMERAIGNRYSAGDVDSVLRSLAASRMLIEEKDKTLRKIAAIEPDTEKGWCFLTSKNIRELAQTLALKEDEMRKRLEVK